MTQDQYGEGRGAGYGVRDDADAATETGEYPAGQARLMTRFQKVASALRGGSDRDEHDDPAADPVTADATGTPETPETAEAPPAGPPWETQRGAGTQPQRDYWDEPRTPAGDRADAVAVTSPDAPVLGTPATEPPEAGDHPATVPDVFGTTGNGAAPGVTGMLGDFSDLTYGDLIPDATQYTDQWQQVQYKFVDDPHASVAEAADIIAQVTAKLEAAIQERQRAIEERQRAIAEQQRTLRGRWGEGSNTDTEVLRETLRMYRTFLDQLIGRRAG